MRLNDLDVFSQIVIQLHDSPDADAVGSGYAIYRYFQSKGKNVRLIYGGRNEISKINMKLLISELDIPIEYVNELSAPELLITVDCCYGEGNVQRFDAQHIAVIDHHVTGKQSDRMAEVRSHLVSCSTLCYAMLTDAGFDVNCDIRIATALYYGLFMDSNQLSEINHPLDRDMIDLLRYDKALINRLKYANFSIAELQTAGIAITNNNYISKYRTAIVSAEPCDPNILGVIGDFVIQVDSIDVCIIYNECAGGYKLSIRSCALETSANELAVFLTKDIGNGGGHSDKAGGFISGKKFAAVQKDADPELYFRKKLDEYFVSYDIIRCTDVPDMGEPYRRYRKKRGVFGYICSADVFAEGTHCMIRTLEGDVEITSSRDLYVMIGYKGEAYPVRKEMFEKKYIPCDEVFIRKFEYAPTLINSDKGVSVPLLPIASSCMSYGGSVISARPLERFTKVFTKWDYIGYMAGAEGDMLCRTDGDENDVYVVKRDIFDLTYEELL